MTGPVTAAIGRSAPAYLAFFAVFFAALVAVHWPVLGLPYFWDELGQFIPAALDILHLNAWVPKTTLPNVHPPGVMAWLALVWKIFGYSVVATRLAMLAVAALGVLATFLVAIELCRPLPGAPAFLAPLLLMCSPLFWSQSVKAQLDMPAMTFTMVALWLFLKNRFGLAAAACVVLVLCKETSLAVPFVFGCWLLWERRWQSALLFFAPALALGAWLLVLRSATGHPLGNDEFTQYNIAFQLHPVRLPVTLLRRLFYLLVDNYHLLGSVAIGWVMLKRAPATFRTRPWSLVGSVALLQIVLVSVFGGAALERYLMPVIPMFYCAVAASLALVPATPRVAATLVMVAGLFSSILISSPLAYPFENNSAFVSFVHLQQRAATFVEAELPGQTVVSAWPLPDALRRPEFGYVSKPIPVRGIGNFDLATVRAVGEIEVLVLYSRTWEPGWGALKAPWIREFLTKYYLYKPQITRREIERDLGLAPIARWEENGQWIEIYTRSRLPNVLILQ